jgi:hypothetical protein
MTLYRCLLWTTILGINSFLATIPSALAQTKESNLILNLNTNQTFEKNFEQAEDLAQLTIVEEFGTNPETSEISLLVSGENNGQIVPLLRSKVSRSQWQRNSSIQRYTVYFGSSGLLLGFYSPSVSPRRQENSRIVSPPTPRNSQGTRITREDDPAYRND